MGGRGSALRRAHRFLVLPSACPSRTARVPPDCGRPAPASPRLLPRPGQRPAAGPCWRAPPCPCKAARRPGSAPARPPALSAPVLPPLQRGRWSGGTGRQPGRARPAWDSRDILMESVQRAPVPTTAGETWPGSRPSCEVGTAQAPSSSLGRGPEATQRPTRGVGKVKSQGATRRPGLVSKGSQMLA